MIKVRINGRVREFDTAEQYEQYLESQNPKPKKKRKKKVDYKAIEEDVSKDSSRGTEEIQKPTKEETKED